MTAVILLLNGDFDFGYTVAWRAPQAGRLFRFSDWRRVFIRLFV